MRRHSRLTKTEKRKNTRKAFIFGILTLTALVAFFFYGLPVVIKFAAFTADLKESSTPVELSDKTPPPPPAFNPLPDATNQSSIEISGSTEPGATVVLSINKKESEFIANKEGSFIYKISLRNGTNTISAFAKDSSGNESQKTETFSIIHDSEQPKLEITSPDDQSSFFGPRQRQVAIEGTTEPYSTVYINDRFVFVDEDGSFTFTTSLSEGSNNFLIKAEDLASNSTEKTLNLNFSE